MRNEENEGGEGWQGSQWQNENDRKRKEAGGEWEESHIHS